MVNVGDMISIVHVIWVIHMICVVHVYLILPRRKHSSGDLHSRLKTRKLLGVGETDDGDVHRSKVRAKVQGLT